MSDADPLASLRDVHEPPPPPAPAPWLTAFSTASLLLALLAIALMVRQRRRQPVEALRRRLCEARAAAPERALTLLAGELRSLARARHGDLAGRVDGEAWLQLLDDTFGTTEFTRGPGRLLGESRYRREAIDRSDTEALFDRLQPLLLRAVRFGSAIDTRSTGGSRPR